jgi:hypothetical protein
VLEPTKQQQIDAALAGWGESRRQALRSKIASAIVSNPDLETQEELRQLLIPLETSSRTLKDGALKLASTIATIPDLEAQEAFRQALTGLVMTMRGLEDRFLNGEAESRPERYKLFRKIRTTYEENCGRAERNDNVNRLDPLIVAHLDFIERTLLPPVDGGAATLVLESTVAEPLPGEAGFPRFWEILAYLLPRDSRQRVYEPARAELLEDYLLSRSCRRGWWSRLAVDAVFLVRTLLLAGECGRVLFASRVVQFWLWVVGLVVAWVIRFIVK